MSLGKFKRKTLGQKLEEKAVLEKELVKIDDKIDEIVGDTKVKIIKKKLKK